METGEQIIQLDDGTTLTFRGVAPAIYREIQRAGAHGNRKNKRGRIVLDISDTAAAALMRATNGKHAFVIHVYVDEGRDIGEPAPEVKNG